MSIDLPPIPSKPIKNEVLTSLQSHTYTTNQVPNDAKILTATVEQIQRLPPQPSKTSESSNQSSRYEVVLNLQGNSVKVTTDQALAIHQKLMVQWQNQSQISIIKFLTPSPSQLEQLTQDGLKVALPHQQAIAKVLPDLIHQLKSTALPDSIKQQVHHLTQTLQQQIPTSENINTPNRLTQWVKQSGFFLEAKLLMAAAQHLPPQTSQNVTTQTNTNSPLTAPATSTKHFQQTSGTSPQQTPPNPTTKSLNPNQGNQEGDTENSLANNRPAPISPKQKEPLFSELKAQFHSTLPASQRSSPEAQVQTSSPQSPSLSQNEAGKPQSINSPNTISQDDLLKHQTKLMPQNNSSSLEKGFLTSSSVKNSLLQNSSTSDSSGKESVRYSNQSQTLQPQRTDTHFITSDIKAILLQLYQSLSQTVPAVDPTKSKNMDTTDTLIQLLFNLSANHGQKKNNNDVPIAPSHVVLNTLAKHLKIQLGNKNPTSMTAPQDNADKQNLRQSIHQIFPMLARIQSQQLQSLNTQIQGTPDIPVFNELHIDIPILHQQQYDNIEMKIEEKEKGQPHNQEQKKQWQVTLTFEIGEKEHLYAKILVNEESVSTVFWSTDKNTFNKVSNYLAYLKKRLEDLGIKVDELNAYEGEPDFKKTKITTHSMIDVRT